MVLIALVWAVVDFNTLYGNGGWGMLGIIVMITIGLVALHVDVCVQVLVKNRTKVNLIEAGLMLLFALYVWWKNAN